MPNTLGAFLAASLVLATTATAEALAAQPPRGDAKTSGEPTTAIADELPAPDLSRLEPPVRDQVRGLDRVVRELARQGAHRAELVEALGTLGRIYAVYEIRDEAAACFEAARRLAPEDPRWPYHLGLLHRDAGDLALAAREFEQALAASPADPAILVRLADLHFALGRIESAEDLYRRAADRYPGAPSAWYGLGRVAASRDAHAEAIGHFTRAVALEPEGSLADYALAQAYRRAGDLERARAAIARYRQREISIDDPYAGALDDAATLAAFGLLRALAGEEERFHEARLLGYALSMLAATDGAIERLISDLASWPAEDRERDRAARARLHFVAGGLLVQRDRQPEAIVELERALALAPDLQGARVELANTLARQGRFAEALEHFDRALAASPRDPELRLKRAAVLQRLARWQDAVDDLRVVAAERATEVEARYRLALSLQELGREEEAVEELRAAAAIDPDASRAAGALHRAALSLARRGRLDAAAAELERALELDPGRGETRSALEAVRRELERGDPDRPPPATP